MKLLVGQLIYIFSKRKDRNVRMLIKFMLILITMITIYSILFHFLMRLEDQRFSWITGFYWALTVIFQFLQGKLEAYMARGERR